MTRWRNSPSNTRQFRKSDKAIQKDNQKSPENKLKNIEICNLNDRIQDSTSEIIQQDTRKF